MSAAGRKRKGAGANGYIWRIIRICNYALCINNTCYKFYA